MPDPVFSAVPEKAALKVDGDIHLSNADEIFPEFNLTKAHYEAAIVGTTEMQKAIKNGPFQKGEITNLKDIDYTFKLDQKNAEVKFEKGILSVSIGSDAHLIEKDGVLFLASDPHTLLTNKPARLAKAAPFDWNLKIEPENPRSSMAGLAFNSEGLLSEFIYSEKQQRLSLKVADIKTNSYAQFMCENREVEDPRSHKTSEEQIFKLYSRQGDWATVVVLDTAKDSKQVLGCYSLNKNVEPEAGFKLNKEDLTGIIGVKVKNPYGNLKVNAEFEEGGRVTYRINAEYGLLQPKR
jgi:hypothetical protein